MLSSTVSRHLGEEAKALAMRLRQVRPLAMVMPMVPAAGLNATALDSIDRYLAEGRAGLRTLVDGYLDWLTGPRGYAAGDAEAQRRFTVIRLRFQQVLTQFDIFADAVTQRSEHGYGIWLGGLDHLARDALSIPGVIDRPPPLLTYLDRGIGAAIRRARTRLPGGGDNPVAIIRVPRERMIGAAVGSSLVHEVGHQAAALLDLVPSLRRAIAAARADAPDEALAWDYWQRTISEIVADLWSVARLGVGSTVGLIGVVSIPRPFVFRMRLDDPHPFPWIRVRISAAIGGALFPDRQWSALADMWERLYPPQGLSGRKRRVLHALDDHVPQLVALMLGHRAPALRGRTLGEALAVGDRQPERLRRLYAKWRRGEVATVARQPTLAVAMAAQARADGTLGAAEEGRLVRALLGSWALDRNLPRAAARAPPPSPLLPRLTHAA
ncbi:MAG: hypothetical protein R3F55_15000 [Alphaproteobacteria bacterium]